MEAFRPSPGIEAIVASVERTRGLFDDLTFPGLDAIRRMEEEHRRAMQPITAMMEETRRAAQRLDAITSGARRFTEVMDSITRPRWLEPAREKSIDELVRLPEIVPIADQLREQVAELVREELEKLLNPPPSADDDGDDDVPPPGQYL
jgi:hypothetical protein